MIYYITGFMIADWFEISRSLTIIVSSVSTRSSYHTGTRRCRYLSPAPPADNTSCRYASAPLGLLPPPHLRWRGWHKYAAAAAIPVTLLSLRHHARLPPALPVLYFSASSGLMILFDIVDDRQYFADKYNRIGCLSNAQFAIK